MLIPDSAAAHNYDKRPVLTVGGHHKAWRGEAAWEQIAEWSKRGPVVIDAYPGSDIPGIISAVRAVMPEAVIIDVEETAAFPPETIEALIAENLTDDRVFGRVSHHRLEEFYDASRLRDLGAWVAESERPCVLVGWGAALVPVERRVLVLADLARWEIQRRQRAGAGNWRADDGDSDPLRKFKRGFFVEWRVADRHKSELLDQVDLLLDANDSVDHAALITGEALRDGLAAAAGRPFRVVPFFDPGVWGGQWMKTVCGLDDGATNFAWCFDCVPEENSLLLGVGGEEIEIPATDLVLRHPRELLGEMTFSRFGEQFPIRFDFLDTVEGGNLSLQVHPLTEYIKETFGMTFTQDESYYLLDATEDAEVYLGTADDVDPARMAADLWAAEAGQRSFPARHYINTFPAKRHDHFSIPAGTVHASGAGSMVLEISATPYIFTFKMWDWDRVGLDGRPRPIHLEHALRNVQWERDAAWTRDNLVGQVQTIGEGKGWREERTGLHELEFIETRRHWFTGEVEHDTRGTVHVLNLVEGQEAVVESPDGTFAPFVVHYAETFIVPAAVGRYRIRPHGRGVGREHATIKAFVRGTSRNQSR